LLFVLLSAAAPAADPAKKWDPARTTAPEDLDELKALQGTVKGVVDKCTPATVAVLYPAVPDNQSAGSGVIVSADGLVLTAAHVIRDYDRPRKGALEGRPLPYVSGKKVSLMLPDGKIVSGKTLGINEGMDSGMIQITDKGPNDGKWPFTPLAKSGEVKDGQWVVSLGHPSGPKEGRSPVARLGRVKGSTKNVLRTDCTLVGGDSGGPLFDLQGRLIGIHSRIGLVISMNMHVPSDRYKADWDKLVAGEWVDKPASARATTAYFGVVFPDDEDEDAWLREVEDDGPAGKAGLQPGDTITRFNETAVKSVRQFRKLMETAKPGERVKITARRGTNSKMEFTVTLAKRA
jgi:serine protease Do